MDPLIRSFSNKLSSSARTEGISLIGFREFLDKLVSVRFSDIMSLAAVIDAVVVTTFNVSASNFPVDFRPISGAVVDPVSKLFFSPIPEIVELELELKFNDDEFVCSIVFIVLIDSAIDIGIGVDGDACIDDDVVLLGGSHSNSTSFVVLLNLPKKSFFFSL